MGIIADTLRARLAELQEIDRRSQEETDRILAEGRATREYLESLDWGEEEE